MDPNRQPVQQTLPFRRRHRRQTASVVRSRGTHLGSGWKNRGQAVYADGVGEPVYDIVPTHALIVRDKVQSQHRRPIGPGFGAKHVAFSPRIHSD